MSRRRSPRRSPRPGYWLVICPEPHVRGGLWRSWFAQNCVAVGWDLPRWSMKERPTDRRGWKVARRHLKTMEVGDRVIPFLLRWRIGCVGTIKALRVTDHEWNPTVPAGCYDLSPDRPGLGRRIIVDWQTRGMPPPGMVAHIPRNARRGPTLSHYTIRPLRWDRFRELEAVLRNSRNWRNLPG